MKKILVAAALSFLAGAYLSDEIKEMRGVLHHQIKDGFAEHPYNLRIVHRETNEGIESYVLDTKTNEYWKVKDKNSKKDHWLLDKAVDYLLQL